MNSVLPTREPLPSSGRSGTGNPVVDARAASAKAPGFPARAMRLLFHPDPRGLGFRNGLSNFVFYFLATAGGSGASVVGGSLGAWAMISVILRRFRLRLEPSDRPIVFASLLFFLVMSASEVIHNGEPGAILDVAALLPFAIPLFLVPRMRLSRFADTLPSAFFGAVLGGAVLLPVVLVEFAFFSPRVQAFAGNPGPLSVTSLLAAGWAVLSVKRHHRRWRLALALVGVIGASVAVILSGMRGAWPLLPVCLAIAIFAQRREFAALWHEAATVARAAVLSLFGLILAIVLAVALPLILARLSQMWSDIGLIAANAETPTSLNLRKEMYGAAVRAIEAQPVFGYGSQNHWAAVTPYLNRTTFEGLTFSHFHNVFLTVGVDAGLIGIAALTLMILAPLWTAWRARGTLGGGRRLAAALILIVAFVGAGMTNIMLFHDILDAVWVFSLALIAASVPAQTVPVEGTGR